MPTAGGPGSLQDHTIVAHKSNLFLLGGQLAGREDEGGLWIFSTDTLTWSRPRVSHGPPSLRGHTASVWGSSMYVWGGLRQVLGASQALWRLDLEQSQEPYSLLSFHLGEGGASWGSASSVASSCSCSPARLPLCARRRALPEPKQPVSQTSPPFTDLGTVAQLLQLLLKVFSSSHARSFPPSLTLWVPSIDTVKICI